MLGPTMGEQLAHLSPEPILASPAQMLTLQSKYEEETVDTWAVNYVSKLIQGKTYEMGNYLTLKKLECLTLKTVKTLEKRYPQAEI